jgi:hypothetical protein
MRQHFIWSKPDLAVFARDIAAPPTLPFTTATDFS